MASSGSELWRVETFSIPALDCPEEMALIEKGLARHPGVGDLDPLYLERRLRVEYDPRLTDPMRIAAAVTELGFPAWVTVAQAPVEAPRRKLQWLTTLAGGSLLLMAAAVWGLSRGMHGPAAAGSWRFLDALADSLCVAATLIAGAPVARAGWRALRLRAADMNLLMSVAAGGALAIGDFFEAATAMVLFCVSLLIESYNLERTRRTVSGLAGLSPTVAHRLQDGQVQIVDPAELRIGDLFLVKPGQRVPVDGEVIAGSSALNEAAVTGESVPVEKGLGSRLYAGSLNGEGSLTVRAVHTAGDSTLSRIAHLVVEAQSSRAPTARFVDQFARRYTPTVMAMALALAVGPPLLAHFGVRWAAAVETSEWFRRALVMLVIACPCALVISTPVTIVCGLYQAARRGLLVKGGQHLENAALVDCVALDKTGTLTTGLAEVVGVQPCDGVTEEEVLRVAASLEQSSEHPLASAILRAARQQGIEPRPVTDFVARRGFGVQGNLDGVRWSVGSPRMMDSLLNEGSVVVDSRHEAATAVCVGAENRWLGTIYLADPPRARAAETVTALRRCGVRNVIVLTGDRRSVAERIARQVGADGFEAELLPEDKVRHVRRLAERYPHLAMVGDGVNDAPALAAARLGIALGTGASDLALETADVVIMSPHLEQVAELVRLGQRVRRLLRENITVALGIKTITLILAAAGPVTMWMAVAADVGASLLVVSNGLRLTRFNGRD